MITLRSSSFKRNMTKVDIGFKEVEKVRHRRWRITIVATQESQLREVGYIGLLIALREKSHSVKLVRRPSIGAVVVNRHCFRASVCCSHL
jgi:hypothetical protein